MTSELYTKKILLGKLREKKSPSESDGHLHDADMHSATPDIYTFMSSRTLTSISTRWGWIHLRLV